MEQPSVSAGAMQVAYLSRDLGAYSNLMQEGAQMQPANRRRLLHLCIVVLIMLETLRHFTESIAYSPPMLGVELLVLALNAYEVISTLWRKRVVNTRVKVLREAMDRGRELPESVPRQIESSFSIASWK